MTYARRYIDVSFTGQGETVTFSTRGKYTLRTSARIQKAGGYNTGTAQIEIRGLSLEHIKQLSTYGTVYRPTYNYFIKVDAGDDINGMSTIFYGNIAQAWGDMKAMPDCPFHVLAYGGGAPSTVQSQPTSYSGPTQATTMLEQLAKKAGLAWEDNGVQCVITDPYFWGSPWKQMKEIIDAGGFNGVIDDGKLAVWPNGGNRGSEVLQVSPQTGMRDYPSFTQYGVQVRTEFRRAITFGGSMNITSDLTPACGEWNIIKIDYDLQANTPRGAWYAILDGARVGAPITSI